MSFLRRTPVRMTDRLRLRRWANVRADIFPIIRRKSPRKTHTHKYTHTHIPVTVRALHFRLQGCGSGPEPHTRAHINTHTGQTRFEAGARLSVLLLLLLLLALWAAKSQIAINAARTLLGIPDRPNSHKF